MPGAHRNYERGPATYEVSVAVAGGLLVEPDGTTGKVKLGTAGSLKILGVALQDGQPDGSNPVSPILDVGWPQKEIAVGYGDLDVDLTYTANCAFGTLLVAAAAGKVTPYTPSGGGASTFDQIVGRCTETGGVLANAEGATRLYV